MTSSQPTENRRHRNRSLGCICRHTTIPYPGFAAFLGSITRETDGQTTFQPYGVNTPLPPESCVGVFSSMYCDDSKSVNYSFHPMFSLSDTPPLVSPEPDDDIDFSSPNMRKKESSSSGYESAGESGSSDHDLLSLQSDDIKFRCRFLSTNPQQQQQQQQNNHRRQRCLSMPSELLENDVTMAVSRDGYAKFETNVDSGQRTITSIRGMTTPDSVIQLARKFGEISAAQQNDFHKSRQSLNGKENRKAASMIVLMSKSGPPTPVKHASNTNTLMTSSMQQRSIGGIASLKADSKMSRPNMFKQMEKVGNNKASIAPRQLNPKSIKDALLRWIQNRVAGYPNVNVTNFSSSWADGMAFCALIHRFAPNSFDFEQLNPANRRENLELAFRVSEENGIYPLLEVDDMIMMGDRPDWKCVFTYVQSFYKQFRDHP